MSTLMWLALVMAAMAVLCGLSYQTRRIVYLEGRLGAHSQEIARLSQKIGSLGQTVYEVCAPRAPEPLPLPEPMPTSTSVNDQFEMFATTSIPGLMPMANPLPGSLPTAKPSGRATPSATTAPPAPTEPSGDLARGAFSPDGTKFAGYEEQIAGKIGVAVFIPAEKRARHLVIFSPSQSTGAGTAYEDQMSVRWLDDKTITYDVLVTKNGVVSVQTETIKIGF